MGSSGGGDQAGGVDIISPKYRLVERFIGRILDFDLETAICQVRIHGEAGRTGEKLSVMDSLIAATAAAHGLTVVTRNAREIERCG